MSSVVSKNCPPLSEVSENINKKKNPQDGEETENPRLVTTHLTLKPADSSGNQDKDVLIRRIRHRKRMNKVRAAVQALLSSPFAAKPDKVSVHEKRWLDDAFAAP